MDRSWPAARLSSVPARRRRKPVGGAPLAAAAWALRRALACSVVALTLLLLAQPAQGQMPASCSDGALTPAGPWGAEETAIDCGGPCGDCVCASLFFGEVLADGTVTDGTPPGHATLVQTCHTQADIHCYDGDTATYQCHEGYVMNESVSTNPVRRCNADSGQQWDGVAAECVGKVCGPPPPIEHGSATVTSTDASPAHRIAGRYPSRVDYTCDEGYSRHGSSMQTCSAAGDWNGMPWIQVECIGDPCHNLAAPEHMLPLEISNEGRYPSNVTYTCAAGYSIVGNPARHCRTDGTWTGFTPHCTGIQCDGLPIIAAGARMVTNGGYYPSTAVYTCDGGNEMDGERTRECQTDGSWAPAAPLCGQPCSSGHAILHASTTCPWGVNGRVCEYACEDGYMSYGTHTCGVDGAFAGGHCLPLPCSTGLHLNHSATDCNRADCGLIGPGFVPCGDDCVLTDDPCKRTYGGSVTLDVCEYTCDEGYRVAGDHVCQSDGSFRGGACEAIPCAAGLSLPHGNNSCSGATGEVCDYSCVPGYSTGGVHMCMPNGSFVGGSCIANRCTSGLRLVHSATVCSGVTSDVCLYSCDVGYTSVGIHICDVDGSFRGGECRANACTDGLVILHSETECSGVTGDTCTFVCNEGYSVAGAHVCDVFGAFRNGTCEPNPCIDGLQLTHSPTVCNGTTTELCDYECDAGYNSTGPHVCHADGVFRGGACVPLQCVPSTLSNSFTVCQGATGDPCLYQCNEGYTGFEEHVCEAEGHFRGGACEPNPCSSGLRLPNSNTTCAGVTLDVCEYTCDAGYNASGSHTCWHDGSFRGGACEAIPCAAGLSLPHGNNSCSGATGEVCDYSCVPGYSTGGVHMCMPNGSFVGGSCIANRCTSGLRLVHSATVCSGVTSDVCLYSCDVGYTSVGIHICDVDGSFRGGECRANACTDGLVILHSETECSGVTGDSCDISCADGYTTVGSHVCYPNGSFAGSHCQPNECLQSTLPYSTTRCAGTTTEVCDYRCRLGYSPVGDHVCTSDGVFRGGECDLVFPCVANVHDCDHYSRATCADTGDGGYSCQCRPGYWGDGRACSRWDVCAAGEFVLQVPTPLLDRICVRCANGTYLPPMAHETACPSCDAGLVDSDLNPATQCVRCPPGTYQPGYQVSLNTFFARKIKFS